MNKIAKMQGGAGAPPCISVHITVDLCFRLGLRRRRRQYRKKKKEKRKKISLDDRSWTIEIYDRSSGGIVLPTAAVPSVSFRKSFTILRKIQYFTKNSEKFYMTHLIERESVSFRKLNGSLRKKVCHSEKFNPFRKIENFY